MSASASTAAGIPQENIACERATWSSTSPARRRILAVFRKY